MDGDDLEESSDLYGVLLVTMLDCEIQIGPGHLGINDCSLNDQSACRFLLNIFFFHYLNTFEAYDLKLVQLFLAERQRFLPLFYLSFSKCAVVFFSEALCFLIVFLMLNNINDLSSHMVRPSARPTCGLRQCVMLCNVVVAA